ncbi:MAG: hypothetical protein M3R41_00785, partial [Pseudomonadota bacterium]|nr:hypothetical protein [Pseudomonadota bacterium]
MIEAIGSSVDHAAIEGRFILCRTLISIQKVKTMRNLLAAIVLVTAPVVATAAEPPVEPRTEAAVKAADDSWSAAELRGDGAFVDWLLMPGYV